MFLEKENEILVSVIIATYRRTETLERAIKSVLEQSYKNLEIIVVDDNSDINWNEKVKVIIDKVSSDKVIYIKNEVNQGSAKTRNIGINKAIGKYITFLDDDDIYLKDKINNQVIPMINEEIEFSVTDLELYSENETFIEKRTRKYITSTDKNSLMKNHLMHHITGTDTMMFKANYIKEIGGFEPIDVGDEFYLMQKAIENGGSFKYVNCCDIKAYVHMETDGLSSGESKINGENSLYEYKKSFFKELDKKSINYINMRHYAVLAFVEIRRKNILKTIGYILKAFLCTPKGCYDILKNRK